MIHHYANIIAASRRRSAYDTDAQAWFDAVVAAGSSITEANKAAVSAFVSGCKADGIWSAIKASCLLCAADTLPGALVPLVGPAPTNVGPFVSGDYSRTTGLIGNRSTKYLNSNRNANADPQNNNHQAVYVSSTSALTFTCAFIGAGAALVTGATHIVADRVGTDRLAYRSRNSAAIFEAGGTGSTTGFIGISRATSTGYTSRSSGANIAQTQTSETPFNGNVFVFARNADGTANVLSDARISFYSIGESINLALLDARLATLMAALT